MTQLALGIDLGGTKINFALLDQNGKIVKRKQIPTNASEGADQILKRISDTIIELSENIPIGIGVGVAGQVDPKDGTIISAPNLKWSYIPIQTYLATKHQLPVHVINDVKAAALGEWRFGAAKGCSDFVALFIGTGIGGGIVSEGHLLTGSSNSAGELGHSIINMNGPKCTCGSWGCLEAHASGWAIARRAREAIASHPRQGKVLLQKCEHSLDQLTTKMICEGYREGDIFSTQIISEAIEALTAGCISIVNGLNPQMLIIGGGVSEGIPDLIARIDEGVRGRALRAALANLKIVSAQLGAEANVIGAASLAFTKAVLK